MDFGKGICSITFDEVMQLTVHRGESDPISGWYSPSYDVRQETYTLKLNGRINGNTKIITSFKVDFIEISKVSHLQQVLSSTIFVPQARGKECSFMDISIFGLGYVGSVSAGCLASMGHKVIGVDVNPLKVEMMNSGISSIVEKDLSELLAYGKSKGLISATVDVRYKAIKDSEISIICVGTPSRSNGSLDTRYLESVCEEIGTSLKSTTQPHIIVVRSTMIPGTMKSIVIPKLEAAWKRA